jgi:tetratricopeptide (TPR) repeat protein/TolB-like protein
MVTTNVGYLRTVLFILVWLTTLGVANSDDAAQDKANPPQASGAEVLAASGAGIQVPDGRTPPGRLVIAVLWFENKTGEPQADHWRYAIDRLLSDQLGHVKALRLRSIGIDFARRQLGIAKGSAIGADEARKMGEIIEAQRVIWGSYTKKNDKWQVTARLLNVATGNPSDETVAPSDDWFDVRDELTDKILKQLSITPTDAERKKMARRWTSSTPALGWYGKVRAMEDEGKPFSEQEESARRAIAEDPNFAGAYLALAATLASQGKFDLAQEAARTALNIEDDLADAHVTLGVTCALQGKYAEARDDLLKAQRLDPDDAETLSRLGQLYAAQGKEDQAIGFFEQARRLEPMDPSIHARLGLSHARKGDRDKALEELKEAERLSPGDLREVSAEQIIWQAYVRLADIPSAVKHAERFVALAKSKGLNPEMVTKMEQAAEQLKATLTPTPIKTPIPKVYAEKEIQTILEQRLTKQELEMVVNPLAGTAEMRRWAQELTKGAGDDLEKARGIFDGLAQRVAFSMLPAYPSRTAQEVFAGWKDPNESFDCDDYAKLYVVLARDVGLPAFLVDVKRGYSGRVEAHACAAVFVGQEAFLVDLFPSKCFGISHKEYAILDDVQTIASHMCQQDVAVPERLAFCEIIAKLCPDLAWPCLYLASALADSNQLEQAETVLARCSQLDSDSWRAFAYGIRGTLAMRKGDLNAAETHWHKAVELYPDNASYRNTYGCVLFDQGKPKLAREEFRAALRCEADPSIAAGVRRGIAAINELIGDDTELGSSGVMSHAAKAQAYLEDDQYDQAIAEFDKILAMDLDLVNPAVAASVAYKGRAFAYIQKEQYTAAIADCNNAIEMDPHDPQPFAIRGEAYYKTENYDQAIADCNKAIALNPNLAVAYRTRGFARKAKGDYDGAIADFNKFQELSRGPQTDLGVTTQPADTKTAKTLLPEPAKTEDANSVKVDAPPAEESAAPEPNTPKTAEPNAAKP